MVFDWADRRIIARNRNRNTLSAFDGFRLRLGDENTPWEIDAIAGYWRGWSPHLVLEPYWLWFEQDDNRLVLIQRDLHTFGLHAFGQWSEKSAWDYDLSLAGQWGETQGLAEHDQSSAASELRACAELQVRDHTPRLLARQ
jgi:hypothetical protein